MHTAFVAEQEMLHSELQNILSELDMHAFEPLFADMAGLLAAKGKLLSSPDERTRSPRGFWALLPLALAQYCEPSAEMGLICRIALACELLHSALDSFDEIEDDDSSEQRTMLGDGRFLNAATSLYTLIPLILDTLCPRFLSMDRLCFLQRLLATELLAAMRGQHQDILAETVDLALFSPESCMHIATAKSGILFRLVCCLATHAVNANEGLIQSFSEIGTLMGVVAQLENDVHDLEKELAAQDSQKSDLRRNKKTLPIVLAHKQLMNLHNTDRNESESEERLQLLAYEQAIKATLGAADSLREKALSLVPQIESIRGGVMPTELYVLLNFVKTY